MIHHSPAIDLKVLSLLAERKYVVDPDAPLASLEQLKAQVEAYRLERNVPSSRASVAELASRDGSKHPSRSLTDETDRFALAPRNDGQLSRYAFRNRAVALPPNTGIRLTASTTAKVMISIAMPSTAIAARSPLSLRS